MPTFYDSNGNSYDLSVEIGRGGEGTVYFCPNDSALVAKIYHEPIDEEKAEKLRWMAANRNDGLSKVAAWITETLHDRAGNVVGFLMPNVRAKEIHELYSLKSRRVHFPEATWQFLLHTAANVARAFYVLHKNDHIMGDVNHGNCVVLADGTVKLIDCDSYSIRTDKMRYRCDVGVATHLAPELQGIDLSQIEREKKHDNFGLAVIIFQLLFLGRHPFAGNYVGAEDKSLEDCIREYRFAYANEVVTQVKQPPGTLSLSQLSPRVADLFKQAFFSRLRPEAREWIEALEDLSDSLKQCAAHIGHHYFHELNACPWCAIETKTGLMLFPFVSNESENEFNIFTIENLLASINIPNNLPAKPFKPNILPPPSLEMKAVKKEKILYLVGLCVLQFIVVLVLALMSTFSDAVFFSLLSVAGISALYKYLIKDTSDRLEGELRDARINWNNLEIEWLEQKEQNLLDKDLHKIRRKIKDYQDLQKEKADEIAKLKEQIQKSGLKEYLSAFDVKVAPIDQNQLPTLHRFNLRTAADISEKRLQSLAAVDRQSKELLAKWRKELEKSYEAKIDGELPETAQKHFESKFGKKRRQVEKEIESVLGNLRSAAMTFRQHQQKLMLKSEALAQNLLQAESNFAEIGGQKVMVGVLVGISLIIPAIGYKFQSRSVLVQSDYKTPRPKNSPTFEVSTAPRPVVEREESLNFYVNENITDQEIARMTVYNREQSAKTLHTEAQKLIEAKDFKKAEKKLRLAVKFADNYENILYTLSNLLYDQKNHSESIVFLKKSLVVNSENENAKLLIGANYMQMKKYDEAEEIFLSVSNTNPNSFEANFNLGLIYKNIGKYQMASLHFETAVEIKPKDIEANFEYGVMLYKTGVRSRAEIQYEVLLNLDEVKAEKLRKVIGGQIPPSVVVTKQSVTTKSK
jgi:DNA-binding helix-hairpin-helix protein with protein kinase domain